MITHVEGGGRRSSRSRASSGSRAWSPSAPAPSTSQAGARPTGARSSSPNTQDCVILGWTPGQGGEVGDVRRAAGGRLRRRRADLDRAGRHRVHARQAGPHPRGARAAATPDTADRRSRARARSKGATFVEPELVCEVEYLEITKSTKKMRAPSFKGLRDDKSPEECVLERPAGVEPQDQRSARRVRTPRARASRGPRARPGRDRRAPGRRGPPRTTGRTSGQNWK